MASALRPSPEAFLLACAVPAMELGERRIAIESPICPVLEDGLLTSMTLIRRWFGVPDILPAIEPRSRSILAAPAQRTTAQLLSGGLDSLATLARNRSMIPVGHPWRVGVGILAIGFDLDGILKSKGESDRSVEIAASALNAIAVDAGIELVSVRTNLLQLIPNGGVWVNKWHGAALSSLAHTLDASIHRLLIASTYDAEHLGPWGSHPLLDGNYSSSSLTIVHDALRLSRLEKARAIAEWPAAIRNLRVCISPSDGVKLNCGRCEKCLRTMLALLALGCLKQTDAFGVHDVESAAIDRIHITNGYTASCWRDLIPPLEDLHRDDLVRAVKRRLREYRLKHGPTSPRGITKWLDANVFGRRLSKSVRSARRRK